MEIGWYNFMSTLVIENLPEKIIFDKSKDLKEAGNEPCRFLEKENSRPQKKKKNSKCKKL